MKRSIQILEYIKKNGPQNVLQLRKAGVIPEGRKPDWYHLRQRGFLKTVYMDAAGLLVCDITEKGKENIIKTKRKEMFSPIPVANKKIVVERDVTVTFNDNTKYTKSKVFYEVYKQPKNFMEKVR